MTSEQMLLGMFKQSQYELTRDKIQRTIMLMSAIGIFVGAVFTALLIADSLNLYAFIGAFLSIVIAFLLEKTGLVTRNIATIAYFSVLCFVFTPIDWYIDGGIMATTPYVSVIIMLAMMLVFSGENAETHENCVHNGFVGSRCFFDCDCACRIHVYGDI